MPKPIISDWPITKKVCLKEELGFQIRGNTSNLGRFVIPWDFRAMPRGKHLINLSNEITAKPLDCFHSSKNIILMKTTYFG